MKPSPMLLVLLVVLVRDNEANVLTDAVCYKACMVSQWVCQAMCGEVPKQQNAVTPLSSHVLSWITGTTNPSISVTGSSSGWFSWPSWSSNTADPVDTSDLAAWLAWLKSHIGHINQAGGDIDTEDLLDWIHSSSAHALDGNEKKLGDVKLLSSKMLLERMKAAYPQYKIVDGTPALPGEIPWQVSVKYQQDPTKMYTYCGATLVSSRFVLTAAHCLIATPDMIFLGIGDLSRMDPMDPGEVLVGAKRFIVHPNFNDQTKEADLALIELTSAVAFDDYKQPAALGHSHTDLMGLKLNVSGWGTVMETGGQSSEVLLRAEVPYVNTIQCHSLYRGYREILPGMICAGFTEGGRDSCSGDSGGPLYAFLPPDPSLVRNPAERRGRMIAGLGVAKTFFNLFGQAPEDIAISPDRHLVPTVVGLVSWGAGCSRPGYPGVYTDIGYYRDWIVDHIGSEPKWLMRKD